ncbi:MAG: hypothetical protein JF628_03440 [Sphingomonas sp.]|jgi:hypothetical protein|nr:hypothetical protein [Sphingomonas sp.]
MTSPIFPLAHALRLLKVELAQARETRSGTKAASLAHSPGAQAGATEPAAVSALQGLRTKLQATRAQGGSLAPAKALRLFVEAALLDELGSALQLDPALSDLVERTCRAIEQDTGSAALLADALQELQALAD